MQTYGELRPNMKRTRIETKYEGDWVCPSCGNLNFSFRTKCNMRNCDTLKPAAPSLPPRYPTVDHALPHQVSSEVSAGPLDSLPPSIPSQLPHLAPPIPTRTAPNQLPPEFSAPPNQLPSVPLQVQPILQSPQQYTSASYLSGTDVFFGTAQGSGHHLLPAPQPTYQILDSSRTSIPPQHIILKPVISTFPYEGVPSFLPVAIPREGIRMISQVQYPLQMESPALGAYDVARITEGSYYLHQGFERFTENSRKRRPHEPDNFSEGDWICPGCGNHNYKFRTVCNKKSCGAPRPEEGPIHSNIATASVSQGREKNSSPPNNQQKCPAGSWVCPSCSNVNFPYRTRCNRKECGLEKPTEPEKEEEKQPLTQAESEK